MKVKTASKTIYRSAPLKSHSASSSPRVRSRAVKENSSMEVSSHLHKMIEGSKFPLSGNYLSPSVSSMARSKVGNTVKRNNSIEFHLIFSVAFGLFLLTSVLERALPHKWTSRNDTGEIRKSVVEQAKEAAHISVGYAFMG